MSVGRIVLVTALAGIIGVGAAILVHELQDTDAKRGSASVTGRLERRNSLPDFNYSDLEGRSHRSGEWRGKVLVLNFWATWCPPCQREIPEFIDMQQTYGGKGLQMVGIAIDEPQAVREFAAKQQVNYPVLLGDTAAADMSVTLGNRLRGLPFTVVFNRKGKIAHSRAGEISRQELEQAVSPLL
jgi:thiol-disulfide isomerase/thioredoxin